MRNAQNDRQAMGSAGLLGSFIHGVCPSWPGHPWHGWARFMPRRVRSRTNWFIGPGYGCAGASPTAYGLIAREVQVEAIWNNWLQKKTQRSLLEPLHLNCRLRRLTLPIVRLFRCSHLWSVPKQFLWLAETQSDFWEDFVSGHAPNQLVWVWGRWTSPACQTTASICCMCDVPSVPSPAPLELFWIQEQKERFLPRLATGDLIGKFLRHLVLICIVYI